MNLDDEQFIYRIGKLSLGPDDVIVIKSDRVFDKDQVTFLRDRMREQLLAAGFDNKVLMLTYGLELQIIEKEDA
jgi:hypothetical protein